MLEDIQELRLALTDIEPSEQVGDSISLIFGAPAALSLQEVITKYLPPRKDVDRLTAAYFRARAITAPTVHAAQFQRLYKAFWDDPVASPPLWTSIIFSICHSADNVLMGRAESSGTNLKFLTASAHCLVLGEFFRLKRFAVEALLLFAQSVCLTSAILTPDLGVVFGLVIRTAIMMGYHRESTNRGLSPFRAEMRRRTWMMCVQLDLLVSFHLGIPSVASSTTWDTAAPKNLNDSDFDENSVELPPERPASELTTVMFFTTKHLFMGVFEKILRHALAENQRHDEVDALDAEVRTVYTGLPSIIQRRTMSESVTDSPSIIVTRLCIYFLYCKCLCVLHRPYVTQRRPESIKACYEASFSLTQDFVDIYHEFAPNGQAETERWFLSSLTWYDFLLGTMALCLVVFSTSNSSQAHLVDRDASIELLKKARDIAADRGLNGGYATRRVYLLIGATIQRMGSDKGKDAEDNVISIPGSSATRDTIQVSSIQQDDWTFGDNIAEYNNDSLWDDHIQELLGLSNEDFMEDVW
jgi:hypothetical protein